MLTSPNAQPAASKRPDATLHLPRRGRRQHLTGFNAAAMRAAVDTAVNTKKLSPVKTVDTESASAAVVFSPLKLPPPDKGHPKTEPEKTVENLPNQHKKIDVTTWQSPSTPRTSETAATKIQAWWRGEMTRTRIAAHAIAQRLRWTGPELPEISTGKAFGEEYLIPGAIGLKYSLLKPSLFRLLEPYRPRFQREESNIGGKQKVAPLESWSRSDIRKLLFFLDTLVERRQNTSIESRKKFPPPTASALYNRIYAESVADTTNSYAFSVERRMLQQLEESRRVRTAVAAEMRRSLTQQHEFNDELKEQVKSHGADL